MGGAALRGLLSHLPHSVVDSYLTLNVPVLFYTLHVTPSRSFAVAAARAPGPPHRACLLHHHQVLPRRPCGLVVIRAALPIARALCHDFLAATVTATLATTALATDTALSVTIVLPQDVQLHVLVYRPRCSACEGRGVRGLQDARGILGDVHTHGMVGHRPQLFVLASLLCASPNQR